MTEIILKAENITKKYGQQKALDSVSIEIRRGMIYGLIGENGAGKSTLMRIIMGLTAKNSGELEIFGLKDKNEIHLARRRLGQSIETPALYPELTAKQNLQVQASVGGITDANISELLLLMNLHDSGTKKTKNFSLGMRQRLAIAVALVTNPEFLILDEPTNGLDPLGIIEMRQIILRLVNEKGITVLISSHLLDELSQLATDYGILHHGKLIKEISHSELSQETRHRLEFEVDRVDLAIIVLDRMNFRDYEVINEHTIFLYEGIDQSSKLNQNLVEAGISVYKLIINNQKLEEYFFQLIGRQNHA